MRMNIILHHDEIKEALLEYIKKHRNDLLLDPKKPPAMKFFSNGKELETVAVDVEQYGDVHTGPHPYR